MHSLETSIAAAFKNGLLYFAMYNAQFEYKILIEK